MHGLDRWGDLLGKAGRRHPSGQLVRADRKPDDRIRTSRQPHRRDLKDEDRLSERAESALGRLALRGVIDEHELAPVSAMRRWSARIARRSRRRARSRAPAACSICGRGANPAGARAGTDC
jgi:hypothetical protein